MTSGRVDNAVRMHYYAFGFGGGWQLSEADLTSRGACESLSLDLPRLTNGYPQAVQSVDPRAGPIKRAAKAARTIFGRKMRGA